MSIALKGLITGIAEGVSSKIDKEREDAKNRVAVRTKNAYENYVKYQEQAAALRAEIKKKDALALQFQPDLTEEERIAIATMPNAIDLYQEAVRNGKQVTLRDVVKVGDKAKGMKYADFIETLGKVEPAAQVQMGERTSVFAPSEERQRQMLDKLSTSVGVSAPELMAFEKPREAPSVAPMGSLSMELFKDKTPKSTEQRLQAYDNAYMDAVEQYGADSQEAKSLQAEAKAMRERMRALKPDQEKFSAELDAAKMAVARAKPGTSEEAAAKKELSRLLNIGKEGEKLPSLAQARSIFAGTATQAIKSTYGNLVGKGIAIQTSLDGTQTYEYTGGNDKVAEQIRAVGLNGIKRQYRTMSDDQGRPLSADIQRALIEVGIDFDKNGVPIFPEAASAATPTPTTPAAAGVGAQRAQVPAATPRALPPEDQEALVWAYANPNDPRAKQIKQRLGM